MDLEWGMRDVMQDIRVREMTVKYEGCLSNKDSRTVMSSSRLKSRAPSCQHS